MFVKKGIIIALIFASLAVAQEPDDVIKRKGRYGFKVNKRPPVNFSVFVDYTDKGWYPQVHTAVSVLNDVLSFEKIGQTYEARYQVTAAILKDDEALLNESWQESVILQTFKETNARTKYQYTRYIFDDLRPQGNKRLSSGEYELFVEIRDLNSRKTLSKKQRRTFFVQKPDSLYDTSSDTLRSTPIAFLKTDTVEYGKPLPQFASGKTLLFNHSGYAYVHFHPSASGELAELNMRIYREENGDRILMYQEFLSFKDSVQNNRGIFTLPKDSLSEGQYILRIDAASGKTPLSLSKNFNVVWFDKPVYLYRKDLAIRPMVYLLPESKFDEVKDLGIDELRQWFDSYWKKKDPTKKTVYNELLYTFFNRVDIANRRFNKPYKEGWQTDRGKIFLLYGPPHEVDNHSYATSGKPYVVWHYNNPDKKFIFVDENNDDEFKLLKDQEKDR
ncbi:MAG: GWxTD domain-containing protein [Caldithrix sp.]|nr:GWxTD domain-containing protein [Caldithrix sp.]